MRLNVAVYVKPTSYRSMYIGEAMLKGIEAYGDKAFLWEKIDGLAVADVFTGYGWVPFGQIFEAHKARGGRYAYIDLGWWGRKTGLGAFDADCPTRPMGYHKISVNARHVNGHMRRNRPHDRINQFGFKVKPWRTGETIVVVGMSAKAARAHGLQHEQWERETIARLQKITKREIIYRAKPGDHTASAIPGSTFVGGDNAFPTVLPRAHAIITRHSNAVVEAMLEGIQVYSEDNIGKFISMPSLEAVDGCHWPDGREQLLADVAYCQWCKEEIEAGLPWADLRQGPLA